MELPHTVQKSPIVRDMPAGRYAWCSCGLSKEQPFCDGTHHGTGFHSVKGELAEPQTVAWCACKRTKTPPFCDGSHARL